MVKGIRKEAYDCEKYVSGKAWMRLWQSMV